MLLSICTANLQMFGILNIGFMTARRIEVAVPTTGIQKRV